MKAPKTTFFALSGLVLTVSFAAAADDHAGHDHSGHSHAEKKPASNTATSATFAIPDSVKKGTDLKIQIIESREIDGKGEAVTAIPKSSVVEMDGKTYVIAQSEDNAETFERWEITTGASDDQFVEAVTGVFPGDKLVSNSTAEIARIQGGPSSSAVVEVESPQPQPQPRIATSAETTAPASVRTVRTETRRDRIVEVNELNAGESGCRFARERTSQPRCNRDLDVRHDYRNEVPARVIVEDFHSHQYREHFHNYRPQRAHYHRHDHRNNW